jgi:hypothetical protein
MLGALIRKVTAALEPPEEKPAKVHSELGADD